MSKNFWLSTVYGCCLHLLFWFCRRVFLFLRFCFFFPSVWLKLASPLSFDTCSYRLFIMDHTQGREFHHHLARALMHLNYLAGLLPFFEPSIEWDEPLNELYPRTGRSHPAPRNLYTFVPLPASSTVPSMTSHGGIPTHMILNPESNLRPFSISSRPRDEAGHSSIGLTVRNPTTESCPPSTPVPRLPVPDTPRVTSRTTTAVPIRSKQRGQPP